MKLTPKKTFLLLSAEILMAALILCFWLSARISHDWYPLNNIRKPLNIFLQNTFVYDAIKIPKIKSAKGMYINLGIIENEDGTFKIFTNKLDYSKHETHLSVLSLDSNLKLISEIELPVQLDFLHTTFVSYDNEQFRLISPYFEKAFHKLKISTLSQDAKLISEKEAERAYPVDSYKVKFNQIQYQVWGETAYIFYDDVPSQRKLLTEIDLNSGAPKREFAIASDSEECVVSEGIIDPKDKSIYFACLDVNNILSIWKYEPAGTYSNIIRQELDERHEIALYMDDKPYLLTSKMDNATELTAYSINANGLDKLWSYSTSAKAIGKVNCQKTGDKWYVSTVFQKDKVANTSRSGSNDHHKGAMYKYQEYYSAVLIFDHEGKYLSQSKYPGLAYPARYHLTKTKDGRILYTGSLDKYHSTQAFVAVIR